MNRFAISTVLAGGLLAGLFGAAGAAQAQSPDPDAPPAPAHSAAPAATTPGIGANVTLPLGASARVGLDGASASMPLGVGEAAIIIGAGGR